MKSFASALVSRAAKKFKVGDYSGACADYERLLQVPDVTSNPETRASCLLNLAVCYTNVGSIAKMVATFETILDETNDATQRRIITSQLHNNIGYLMVTRFDERQLEFFKLLPTELMITVVTQKLMRASENQINGNHVIDIIQYSILKKLMNDVKLWDECIITVLRFFCDMKDLRVLKLEKMFETCGELYYSGLSKYWRGQCAGANVMFQIYAQRTPIPERDTPLAFYRASSALRGMTNYEESTVDTIVSEVTRAMSKPERERPTEFNDFFFHRFLITIYDTCRERNSLTLSQDYTEKCVRRLGWCIKRDFDDSVIRQVDDRTKIIIVKRGGVIHAKRSEMLVSTSCDEDDPLSITRALVLGATTHSTASMLSDEKSMTACLKSGNVVKLTGYVFALNVTNQINHYHIVCEIFTRLAVLKQHADISANEISIILFKGVGQVYVDTCRRMGFTKIMFYEDTATYFAEQLLFVDMAPDHMGYLDSWCHYLPSMAGLKAIRKTLIDLFDDESKRMGDDGESVIYISRGGAATGVRHMRNEKEFIDDILIPLYGSNLVIFDDSFLARNKDPMKAQIELFSNARLIIGTHGAGLSNTLFARPGTNVVEFSMHPNCNRCFEYIAQSCGLNYFPCNLIPSFYYGNYEYDSDTKGPLIKEFLLNL